MFLSILTTHLPSSMATRGTLIALSTISIAVAVKTAIDIAKINKPSTTKNKPIHVSQARHGLHTAARKHWLQPTAIALGTYIPRQRGPKLIEWHEKKATVSRPMRLHWGKDHTIAVEEFLNAKFYRTISRSLGAPCQLAFDVEPRHVLDGEIDGFSIYSIEKLKALVLRLLQERKPRTYQLRLTQFEHVDPPTTKDVEVRRPVLVESPTLRYKRIEATFARTASILSTFRGDKVVVIVQYFTVELYFRVLTDAGIVPQGFMNCLTTENIISPAPYEEPLYLPNNVFTLTKTSKGLSIPIPTYHPDDWVDRGFPGPLPNNFDWQPVVIDDAATAHDTQTTSPLARYHSMQTAQAKRVIKRVEDDYSVVSLMNQPEGEDYFFYQVCQKAYAHEIFERERAYLLPDGGLEKWLQDASPDAQTFLQNRAMAMKYWEVFPGQYEEFFGWMDGDSSSSEEFGSSESSDISEVRVDSPVSSQSSNGEQYFDRSVLDDPAVLHVVFRKPVQPLEQPDHRDSIFYDPAILHAVVKKPLQQLEPRQGIYQDAAVLHATVKRPAQHIHIPITEAVHPVEELYACQQEQYAATQQQQYYNQFGKQQHACQQQQQYVALRY
jgi:hypothetical protein